MTPWSPPRLLDRPTVVVLTHRQSQILDGICRGLTNRQIAVAVGGVSEDTVKTTTSHLFRAMGARDRCHAAALASQLTIVVKEPVR